MDLGLVRGIKSASSTIILFCSAVSAVIFLIPRNLMHVFVNPSEVNVINLGIEYLSVISIFYMLIGFLFMFYGFFRGVGALRVSVILTIISLGTRVVMAYILSSIPPIGQRGIWWSIPLGWALADITGFFLYRKMKREGQFSQGIF